MKDENIFGILGLLLFFIISVSFGACMNSTYLSLPNVIQEKIKTDANNNYRTSSSEIEYIINEYYKDK